MDVNADLAMIALQERELAFASFDEDVAWALGSLLRERARAAGWPVVVEVRSFHRELFFAALPGSTPDNAHWARRKRNVVERFHRSSYAVGLELTAKNTTLEARYGLPAIDYASHGGAFPITLAGSGVMGCAVVSGLPQRDDHMAVVRAVCDFRGLDGARFDLSTDRRQPTP